MTKKEKKNLENLIRGVILIIGFWILYVNDYKWPFLIGLIIGVYILPSIIVAVIPNKQPNKKKTTSTKKTKNSTTAKVKVPKKEHNLIRTEKEILTLPLEELSWREFERLCFLYYKGKGYKVEETTEGADGGVDLIVYNKHHNAKVAIQIKHRKSGNQVTVKEIRELNSAKRNHNCQLADFITSSTYTNPALQEADKFHIETRDIFWIENNILKWREQEAKKRKLA